MASLVFLSEKQYPQMDTYIQRKRMFGKLCKVKKFGNLYKVKLKGYQFFSIQFCKHYSFRGRFKG